MDILKLPTNVKCRSCWVRYCSVCTKYNFQVVFIYNKNVGISRWNPGSFRMKGKTSLGCKRGSISPLH